MTSWGKPSAYLLAYKYANASEWRRHLAWLEERGYPFIAQLQKELAREDRKGRANPKAGDQGTENRGGAALGGNGAKRFSNDGQRIDSTEHVSLWTVEGVEDGDPEDKW